MALKTAYIAGVDPQYGGNDYTQKGPIIADVYDSMADNDTAQITLDAPGDTKLPPRSVTVYRHTGGDITSLASATFAVNNGNTIEFWVDDDANGKYTQIVHALAGVTNGAATAAQIAASINGDAVLSKYVVAVAGLTANAVTLFPRLARSKFYIGAQPAVLGWAGVADYAARTYVSQNMGVLGIASGFSWSYNAATRVLTVQNELAAAADRVHIEVHR